MPNPLEAALGGKATEGGGRPPWELWDRPPRFRDRAGAACWNAARSSCAHPPRGGFLRLDEVLDHERLLRRRPCINDRVAQRRARGRQQTLFLEPLEVGS